MSGATVSFPSRSFVLAADIVSTFDGQNLVISGGTSQTAVIPPATATTPGIMSSQQASKLANTPEPYIHTQSTPSSIWTVNHNLGYIPQTTLFTSGGVEFDGEIINISSNQVQVILAVSIAGTARCI